MSVGRRRIKLLGILMMVNVCIYLIVEVSKSSSQEKNGKGEVIIPKERFWKISDLPQAYWNKEQEKLNRRFNPILNTLANQTGEASGFSNISHLNYCEPDLRVMSVVSGFDSLPDRFKDFLLYLRGRNYSLLIDQPDKCAKKPFLLLAIKSLTSHFIEGKRFGNLGAKKPMWGTKRWCKSSYWARPPQRTTILTFQIC